MPAEEALDNVGHRDPMVMKDPISEKLHTPTFIPVAIRYNLPTSGLQLELYTACVG